MRRFIVVSVVIFLVFVATCKGQNATIDPEPRSGPAATAPCSETDMLAQRSVRSSQIRPSSSKKWTYSLHREDQYQRDDLEFDGDNAKHVVQLVCLRNRYRHECRPSDRKIRCEHRRLDVLLEPGAKTNVPVLDMKIARSFIRGHNIFTPFTETQWYGITNGKQPATMAASIPCRAWLMSAPSPKRSPFVALPHELRRIRRIRKECGKLSSPPMQGYA